MGKTSLLLTPQEMMVLTSLSYKLSQAQQTDVQFLVEKELPVTAQERGLLSAILYYFRHKGKLLELLQHYTDWTRLVKHREFTQKNAMGVIVAIILLMILGVLLYGTSLTLYQLVSRTSAVVQEWISQYQQKRMEWDEEFEIELYDRYKFIIEQQDLKRNVSSASNSTPPTPASSSRFSRWFNQSTSWAKSLAEGSKNAFMNQTGLRYAMLQGYTYQKDTMIYIEYLTYFLLFLVMSQIYVMFLVTPKQIFWALFFTLTPVYFMMSSAKKKEYYHYYKARFKEILKLFYRLYTQDDRLELEQNLEQLIREDTVNQQTAKSDVMKNIFIQFYAKNLKQTLHVQSTDFKSDINQMYQLLRKELVPRKNK